MSALLLIGADTQASDSLKDVQDSYHRSMKHVHSSTEFIVPEQRAHLTKFLEFLKISFKEHANTLPALQTTSTLKSFQALENFQDSQKIQHAAVHHALTAALSFLSDYALLVQNDHEYAWTHQQGTLVDRTGKAMSVSGSFIFKNTGDAGATSTFWLIRYKHLYEIERQRIHIDLTSMWNLIAFWKKKMFPSPGVTSYNALQAQALQTQIQLLIEKRSDIFQNAPYAATIIDLLKDIQEAVEKAGYYIIVNMKTTSQKKARKMRQSRLDLVKQEEHKANEPLANFFVGVSALTTMLQTLQEEVLVTLKNPNFKYALTLFNENFNESQQEMMGKKEFIPSPFNIEKILPPIETFATLLNIPPNSENAPNNIESRKITKEKISTLLTSTELFLTEKKQETPTLSEENQPTQNQNFFSEDALVLESENEEKIAYDTAYWVAEHQRHQERKKQEIILIQNHPIRMVTQYEIELLTYLNETVFPYTPLKKNAFVGDLAKLGFIVQQNRNGKGSLYYVSAKDTHPLFGVNTSYEGSYFNIHLPHENEVIPAGYYQYIRSGFSNIFGLTKNYVQETLQMVKKN